MPNAGDVIREARGERSQADVAGEVGVDQTTVSRWERSEAIPNLLEAAKLCDVLDIEWSKFDPRRED